MTTTLKEMMAAGLGAGPTIAPRAARGLLEGGQAIAVDVRDDAEVAASGRIKGALHIARGHLEFEADPASPRHNPALPRDKTLLVYCNSGARATLACKTLKDMGYADVRNLGGFTAWVAEGGPVER